MTDDERRFGGRVWLILRVRWRALLVTVVLVLVPAFSLRVALWALGSGSAALVNGDLVVRGDADVPFIGTFVVCMAWAVAMLAALTVAGSGTSPVRAVGLALRRLPFAAGLPIALAVASLWALASGVALTFVGVAALVVLGAHALHLNLDPFFIAIGFIAVVTLGYQISNRLGRIAQVVPASTVDGTRGWAAYRYALERSRDRPRVELLVPGLTLLVGLLAWILRSGDANATLVAFGADAGLIALVVVQATLLAAAWPVPTPEQRADISASAWVWPGIAVASTAVPALLAATVLAVNPYHLARWQLAESTVDDEVLAVAWPEGQHPLIVTGTHVVDCVDDRCARQSVWNNRPGSAGIGADGTVTFAEMGEEMLRLSRCTRTGQCTPSVVPWPGSAQILVTAVPEPGGAILVATAGRASDTSVDLALSRCADMACASPQVVLRRTAEAVRTAELVIVAGDAPDVRYVSAAPAGGLLARSTDSRYAVRAEAEDQADPAAFGPLGAVAEALPPRQQLVLVECADTDCAATRRRWPANIVEHIGPTARLVVRPDRRVLLVEAAGRLLVATTTLPA